VPLASIPSEIVLQSQCEGHNEELARQPSTAADSETDATLARILASIRWISAPFLPPHDWLLRPAGKRLSLRRAALSHARDLPEAKTACVVRRGKALEMTLPLVRNQRASRN